MTDIVPIDSAPWQAVTMHATGLTFTRDVSFEDWQAIGERLQYMGRAIQFWIGDWIRYGESHYGETYTQAIEATGYEEKTLRNAVYVAEHVEMSRRRDNLSFAHHAEVAALEPAAQDAMLGLAERHGLTRNELRDEVHRFRQVGLPPKDEPPVYVTVLEGDLRWLLERYEALEDDQADDVVLGRLWRKL